MKLPQHNWAKLVTFLDSHMPSWHTDVEALKDDSGFCWHGPYKIGPARAGLCCKQWWQASVKQEQSSAKMMMGGHMSSCDY